MSDSRKSLRPRHPIVSDLPRRQFLAASAAAIASIGVSSLPSATAEEASGPVQYAGRPKPPYRVWFQPRLWERDIDLYRNMTIDASGWIDPRLTELAGKTTLDWVYGLNHPYAKGPDYWREVCSTAERGRPKAAPQFISAGIAVDEWVPPAQPSNERWLAEGLRAGRKANPDVFIAVWSTDPTPELLELGKDGTVDLMIVEGYTHSVEPGLTTSWEGALRRTDAFVEAGLEEKTIFSFGHITDREDSGGGHLKGPWLRERAEELKKRYPKMPGVAFFQSVDPDTPELRELVRYCDQLSGELWPDPIKRS